MPSLPPIAELIADARLAGLVAVSQPALLFGADGHVLFANPAGLKLIGASTLTQASLLEVSELGPIAEAAMRLAPQLSSPGPTRLQRMKLPGANSMQPQTFAFSRLVLQDGSEAVLAAGLEGGRERPPSLLQAVGTLLDDEHDAFALFDLDGNLIEANTLASLAIGEARSLQEMEPAAEIALAGARTNGVAEFLFGTLRVVLRRIGTKAQGAMLAFFADAEISEPASEITQPSEISHPAASDESRNAPARF